jgi:molybdopterin-guanine dinucleotide biosynthesis protein MobB
MQAPVFGIVGYKDNGKTTLLVGLVRHLTGIGLRVSTIKHAHHEVDIDQPGKDTWRHREAGSTETVLATSRRFAIVHELRNAQEPSLEGLLARMSPVDLVLVEGFKRHGHAKLEVHRTERDTPLLARQDPTIVAVASDGRPEGLSVPVFSLDDVPGIARFILRHSGIEVPR